VQELDIESIINESSDSEMRRKLEDELTALRGELSSVSELMERTYAVLSGGGPVEFVTNKLNELERKRTELARRVDAKNVEQIDLLSREARYSRSKEEIRQLVEQLQSPATVELFKLRAQIASQLKVFIETLSVATLGERPRIQKSIDYLRTTAAQDTGDVIAYMEQLVAHPDQCRRYFAVGFRDSKARIVFPAGDDPLRYEQQIVAKERLSIISPDGRAEDL
jgi:hypothetical protein